MWYSTSINVSQRVTGIHMDTIIHRWLFTLIILVFFSFLIRNIQFQCKTLILNGSYRMSVIIEGSGMIHHAWSSSSYIYIWGKKTLEYALFSLPTFWPKSSWNEPMTVRFLGTKRLINDKIPAFIYHIWRQRRVVYFLFFSAVFVLIE